MIETLVNVVLYVVILGLIFWLLDYIIANVPVFEPFRGIARTILVVVACLILIVFLLQLLPGVPRIKLG